MHDFGQAYDAKIDILASLNLGWLLLGHVSSRTLQRYLALLVTYYTKQLVSQHASLVRNQANVSLPNQSVHKIFMPTGARRDIEREWKMFEGEKQLPYVLLEEDGAVGKANRAQRGFENLMESLVCEKVLGENLLRYLPMYLAYLCAVGFVSLGSGSALEAAEPLQGIPSQPL